MAITVRPITCAEVPAFRALLVNVFGIDLPEDAQEDERFANLLPPQRTCAAFDHDKLVASSGTFELELTIPGGTIPVAGLTAVAVAPTHRRLGLGSQLVTAHLDAAAARGDAISALWASEASIYGRFGFGIATELDDVEVDNCHLLAISPDQGEDQVEAVAPEQLAELVPPAYDQARATRAGMLHRTPYWWQHRHFRDPPERRGSGSTRRYVLARRDGVATGYICYRQELKFERGLANGQVTIVELVATDTQAEASLLRFASRIDLHPRLCWWNAPTDSAFPWIVSDYRRVARRRADAVWLRINDVPTALAARSYANDGSLQLQVTDPIGRDTVGGYALQVANGRGSCRPLQASADLTLDVGALGSIYLGGVRPSLLARAGRIRGSESAVRTADALFVTACAPWCAEMF